MLGLTDYSPRVAHRLQRLTLAQLRHRYARAHAEATAMVDRALRDLGDAPYMFANDPAAWARFNVLHRYQGEISTVIFYKKFFKLEPL